MRDVLAISAMSIEPVERSQITAAHPVSVLSQYLEKKRSQAYHSTAGRVDLLEIVPLLPWLMIIEDRGQGTDIDFWIKFAGPAITGLIGTDPTGTRISEGLPTKELAETIRRECLHAQLSKQPRFSKDEFKMTGMARKKVFVSVYPLSKSAGLTMDELFWLMAPCDTEMDLNDEGHD